ARRSIRGLPPMIPAVFQVTLAMIITGTIAIVVEHPWTIQPTLAGVGAIVWLGIFGSGFAYLAFFRLLSHWGATRTTAVAYLLPIVAIALGFLVLGEQIDARTVIGTLLIIGGVALVNSRFGRQLIFARTRPRTA
ncbi:MAG: DMT family transporter, partial [Chloroflexi bacterium]